jgi:hypothetical protein
MRQFLAEAHMMKLMSIPGAGPAKAPFHYTMSGLEDVWLLNGFSKSS